jgi:transcriptional regulator with XRE-family HTH domain
MKKRKFKRGIRGMQIGERLKSLRKERGLTLQQIADATNLSIGFLSNVERDVSSPTISALLSICIVLAVDLSSLLQPEAEERNAIRKSERKEIFYSRESKVKYEALTEGNKKIKSYSITMEPGAYYGEVPLGHPKEDEASVVIEGLLEIEVGGTKYVLHEGDSIYINAGTPHKYINIGEGTCILYCFLA